MQSYISIYNNNNSNKTNLYNNDQMFLFFNNSMIYGPKKSIFCIKVFHFLKVCMDMYKKMYRFFD